MNSPSSPTLLPRGEGSPLSFRERARVRAKRVSIRLLWLLILAPLLYFALRNAPLPEIWQAVSQLKFWQIAVLVSMNIFIYLLITLRWWIIIHAENKTIAYLPLVLVRVAVFGVSYFTFGPQVGGEPLQVFYLQRKYGMSYTRATSTVIMDKLLEFLSNFFLLAFGLTAILQVGIISTNGNKPLVSPTGAATLVALLIWPPLHIMLMMRGIYPIGATLRAACSRFGNPKWMRFVIASERMAGMFCQRYTHALIAAVMVSILTGTAMVSEYTLITSFLGIRLHGWQTLAAWTTSWLAFLIPLPGGLGALEASQVFTLGVFEISAALAIGVALLIRARDLLIGGLGLLFASRGVKSVTNPFHTHLSYRSKETIMKLTSRHYGIIILTLITAFLHIAAALDKQLFPDGPDPLFILNGLGYLGLLGAYFLPIAFFQGKHELVRKGYMLYAVVTIVAWLIIWVGLEVIPGHHAFFDHDSLYGVPAKISEVILLFLLSADKSA